ncbi:MAG: aspartyl protease family protein [Candidatus Bathyarchaeia archaeon]
MGFTTVKVKVSNPRNAIKSTEVALLVDTGATFTVIPRDTLEGIGIKPRVKRKLRTTDGRVAERDGATALVRVRGKVDEVPILFGESGDAAIMGITTLEILGFELDPITRQLKPTEYLLL